MESIFELSPKLYHTQQKLLEEARTAIAWGIPDNESTGYSASEFTKIIHKLVRRVEQLEKENEQLRSKA